MKKLTTKHWHIMVCTSKMRDGWLVGWWWWVVEWSESFFLSNNWLQLSSICLRNLGRSNREKLVPMCVWNKEPKIQRKPAPMEITVTEVSVFILSYPWSFGKFIHWFNIIKGCPLLCVGAGLFFCWFGTSIFRYYSVRCVFSLFFFGSPSKRTVPNENF